MRPLTQGELINAVQAIRGRTDLSERERARRLNSLMEQTRGYQSNVRADAGGSYGESRYRGTQSEAEGGTPIYQTSHEIRVPHILWIALFWSIVMMFIAENLLP